MHFLVSSFACVVITVSIALPAAGETKVVGHRVDLLATFRAGASLQGIDIAKDGAAYISVNADDVIIRVTPDGKQSEFAKLPIHPHGILVTRDGFVIAGQTNRPVGDSTTPPAQRFGALDGRFLVLDRTGKILKSIAMGAATFPNGVAALPDGTYLVADSLANVVWRVDTRTESVSTWSADPFLRADPSFPGANGIKIANGWVYASNTIKQQIARTKLGKDSMPDGPFAVIGSVAGVDEIAVTKEGTVYAADHRAMAKVSPSGETVAVFENAEGGSTLVLSHDQKSIYAVTDGVGKDGTRSETRLLRIWF